MNNAITQRIPWRIHKDRCALLIIDMQNEFLKPGGVLYQNDIPMSKTPAIKRLSGACREMGVPVAYTQTFLRDGFHISPLEACYQPLLFERGLREGTWGGEIIDELTPQPGDEIIVKHRYDAFFNTNLELWLRNIRGMGVVDTLIIAGTVTNVCCESTARAAFMRDFKVVFAGDANGSPDEEAHRVTLRNIGRFFGRVLDTDALITALGAGEGHLTPILEGSEINI